MLTVPLILLVAGCAALLYAARYARKAWVSRRRPRAARLEWEFSFRLFPIPQCSLQMDDADSIAWIAHRLSGVADVNTAVLPLTRPVMRNGTSEARRSTKRRLVATLRYYSYYYLSPAAAVIGSVLAISLLLYQAGWTVNAIRLRVLDPTRRPIGAQWNGAYEAHGASTRVSMTRSIQALRRRDGNSLLSAVASSRRGLDASSVQAGEAVVQEQSTYPSNGGPVLQPLIPGVTVPFTHSLPLLFALFLSQIIHELGHLAVAALYVPSQAGGPRAHLVWDPGSPCATSHEIPPLRIVAGLYAFLPFAAVVLPSSINHAEPKTLLRIAAAGPYHNFLTYLVLLLLPLIGVHKLFYEDVASLGVYVTYVSESSPLKGYLPEDVIIVHLDDVPLGIASENRSAFDSPVDVWSTYLSSGHRTTDERSASLETWNERRGWCVTDSAFRDAPLPPCPPSTGIRFVRVYPLIDDGSADPVTGDQGHHCFSAYPLLSEPTVDCATSCQPGQLCIRPAPEEGILRIRFVPAARESSPSDSTQTEQVVLFAGEREAVHRDVKVSTWRPRGGLALRGLVRWGKLVTFYVGVLSLALATLNLLPLPRLDGTHILSALLGLVFKTDPEDELEEHELREMEEDEETPLGASRDGTRRALLRKRRWHRAITWTTTGMAVICIGGGLVLEAL